MKKKCLFILSLVLLSGLTTLFSGCDKDTNSYVDVYVVDEATKRPLQHAYVKIDIENSYVNDEGYTQGDGHYLTQFRDPAIFNVYVEYEDYDCYGIHYDENGEPSFDYAPSIYKCYRTGSNTVRLKEGETVEVTVNVSAEVFRERR